MTLTPLLAPRWLVCASPVPLVCDVDFGLAAPGVVRHVGTMARLRVGAFDGIRGDDGIDYLTMRPDEVLVDVRVPAEADAAQAGREALGDRAVHLGHLSRRHVAHRRVPTAHASHVAGVASATVTTDRQRRPHPALCVAGHLTDHRVLTGLELDGQRSGLAGSQHPGRVHPIDREVVLGLTVVRDFERHFAGLSFEELRSDSIEAGTKRRIVVAALAFVLGFTTVFVALGATAARIQLASAYQLAERTEEALAAAQDLTSGDSAPTMIEVSG